MTYPEEKEELTKKRRERAHARRSAWREGAWMVIIVLRKVGRVRGQGTSGGTLLRFLVLSGEQAEWVWLSRTLKSAR